MTVSTSIEEYLENIYRLQEMEGVARTKELAGRMRVALGTVTNTIESLERKGLIKHRPYRGVKLTRKGERMAVDVLRRHRLAERLLTDILKMDWMDVHEVACKLEHDLTRELTILIEKSLGHPETCPHGNPIPTMKGQIKKSNSKPLTSLRLDEKGRIVKIVDENRHLLQYLSSLGLIIGASVKVKERVHTDSLNIILLEKIGRPLEAETANKIWVEKI
ncbi:MAG: metal-dependent transcriptional regulator [Candidatus Bathyarchaeia archaeon]